MISVVVSVYKKEVFEDFKKNLADTIGVPYEVISVDNSEGKMGLCEVYNKGAGNARYDVICFAHEDILIRTKNWGEKIVQRFIENPQLGLLGVVGTLYKSYAPNGWGVSWELSRANFVQHNKYSGVPSVTYFENPANEEVSKVICVDGMWMCSPKRVALEVKFDECTFKKFHCYDLDYSLRVFQKYVVGVTFDVKIEHFSEGNTDASWIRETIKLHKKWAAQLPIALEPVSGEMKAFYEKQALTGFIDKMKSLHFSLLSVIKVANRNLKNPALKPEEAKAFTVRLIKEHIKFDILKYPRQQKKQG